MSVGDIWGELESQQRDHPSSGILARRIYQQSGVDLFAAIRTDSRLLILKCSPPADYLSRELPASRGFKLRFVRFPEDGPDEVSLELELVSFPFRDVFTVLVDDVANSVATHARKGTELDVLATRLARWQKFFDQHDPEGLGEESQRGLFAELWFLRERLLPHVRPFQIAIQGWTGPSAAAKDFELPGCAIEIKSTLSKQHHRVLIANERQLDDTSFDRLFLFCLVLEKMVASGETLPAAVTAIRLVLEHEPAALADFEERLLRAGYLDVHRPIYAKTQYAIRGQQMFRVENGFPRVIGSNLLPGVGDVRYSVVLSACSDYQADDNELTSRLTVHDHDA